MKNSKIIHCNWTHWKHWEVFFVFLFCSQQTTVDIERYSDSDFIFFTWGRKVVASQVSVDQRNLWPSAGPTAQLLPWVLYSAYPAPACLGVRIPIGRGHLVAKFTVAWDGQFFVNRYKNSFQWSFFPSLYNSWYGVSIFSVPTSYTNCHILSWDQLSFYPCAVDVVEYCPVPFNMSFLPTSNPWDIFILFITTTFPIDVDHFGFTECLWLHIQSF